MANFIATQMDEITGVPCPCGTSRRAFATEADGRASLHITDISAEARVHYHRRLTEIYLILEGTGSMELDGEIIPVRPYSSVMVLPGCRHRAVGALRAAITVLPAFDPADEWFD
jgi:mannose-6-phosphate isomerase-like protein (cupin superfamily)